MMPLCTGAVTIASKFAAPATVDCKFQRAQYIDCIFTRWLARGGRNRKRHVDDGQAGASGDGRIRRIKRQASPRQAQQLRTLFEQMPVADHHQAVG